jgi:hypothetical protein
VRTLLVVLTLLEIALVVAVLVGYLVALARSLRRTAVLLGKVSFGVRAIETQTRMIESTVPLINQRVEVAADAVGDLATLASDRSKG